MYTREMEKRYLLADAVVKNAEEALRPLKIARDKVIDDLGDMRLHCPQKAGTRGAAAWAIGNADYLIEMLTPFVTPPAK